MQPTKKILGTKFGFIREARFKTQRQVADAMGISEGGLRKIERRVIANVSLKNIPKLAAAIEMGMEEFLREFTPKETDPQEDAMLRMMVDGPIAEEAGSGVSRTARMMIELASLSRDELQDAVSQVPMSAFRTLLETFEARIREAQKVSRNAQAEAKQILEAGKQAAAKKGAGKARKKKPAA